MMGTKRKYCERLSSRTIKERSKKQETRLAKTFNGIRTPASGALDGFKSDVVSEEYRIEAKRTDGKSLTLKLADVEKICTEAYSTGKIPVLALEIGGRSFLAFPEFHIKELEIL